MTGKILFIIMIAECDRIRYVTAYDRFESFVKALCGRFACGNVSRIYHKVRFLLIKHPVHIGGSGSCVRIACHPMNVCELYNFQFPVAVVFHALGIRTDAPCQA